MEYRILSAAILLLVYLHTFAETLLIGTPDNPVIEKSGNPYIINDNLTIPSGKVFTINKGCILVFKPFTGIIVEGSLIVKGSADEPVIFTTINDQTYNPATDQFPNPFDWNGILITPNAGNVRLSDFLLEYSVYGIKSQKEDITIAHGTFSNNGQFHVAIKDALQPVVEKVPFNYHPISFREDTTAKNAIHRGTWQRPLGITLSLLGIGSAATGIFCFYERSRCLEEYDRTSVQEDMDYYYTKAGRMLAWGITGSVLGGLLLPTGLVLTFKKTSRQTALSFTPYLGPFSVVIE